MTQFPVMTFEKTSHDIRVSVTPVFLEEDSRPEDHFYLWAYQVRIENRRKSPVTIVDRMWNVVDAHGTSKSITGIGIFKNLPPLKPGDAFEYTNSIPLSTTSGFMMGQYALEGPSGKFLDIDVPSFSLDSPYEDRTLN